MMERPEAEALSDATFAQRVLSSPSLHSNGNATDQDPFLKRGTGSTDDDVLPVDVFVASHSVFLHRAVGLSQVECFDDQSRDWIERANLFADLILEAKHVILRSLGRCSPAIGINSEEEIAFRKFCVSHAIICLDIEVYQNSADSAGLRHLRSLVLATQTVAFFVRIASMPADVVPWKVIAFWSLTVSLILNRRDRSSSSSSSDTQSAYQRSTDTDTFSNNNSEQQVENLASATAAAFEDLAVAVVEFLTCRSKALQQTGGGKSRILFCRGYGEGCFCEVFLQLASCLAVNVEDFLVAGGEETLKNAVVADSCYHSPRGDALRGFRTSGESYGQLTDRLHMRFARGRHLKRLSRFFPDEDLPFFTAQDEISCSTGANGAAALRRQQQQHQQFCLGLFKEMLGRIPALTRCICFQSTNLRHFHDTHRAVVTDGPTALPAPWRCFLAMMAAARHYSESLLRHEETLFIAAGGDPLWLVDFSSVPDKLKRIQPLNRILAHCPWRISPDLMRDLMSGVKPWTITELCQAILILTHYHSMACLVCGLGLSDDMDLGLPSVLDDEMSDDDEQPECFQGQYDDPREVAESFFRENPQKFEAWKALHGGVAADFRSNGDGAGRKMDFAQRVVSLLSLYPTDGKWDDIDAELQKVVFTRQRMHDDGTSLKRVMARGPARRSLLASRFRHYSLGWCCTSERPKCWMDDNEDGKCEQGTSAALQNSRSTIQQQQRGGVGSEASWRRSSSIQTWHDTDESIGGYASRQVDALCVEALPAGAYCWGCRLLYFGDSAGGGLGVANSSCNRDLLNWRNRGTAAAAGDRGSEPPPAGEDPNSIDADTNPKGCEQPENSEEDGISYQDFNPQLQMYLLSSYSLEESCFMILDCYHPGVADRIRAEIENLLSFTNGCVGEVSVPSTRPLRMAAWHYVQRLYGVTHDNYSYNAMNNFLSLRQKVYLKKLVCFPERVTYCDFNRLRETFSTADIIHFCAIAVQSRKMATLNFALNALSRTMVFHK